MFVMLRPKILLVLAIASIILLLAVRPTNARTDESARADAHFSANDANDQPQIVFSSQRSMDWEVYMMNADGSNQREITFDGPEGEAQFPTWSPDGKSIVFNTGSIIQVMDTQGKNVRSLSDYGAAYGWFPVWSPDSKQIAFAGGQGRVSQVAICIINADGSN